jgi:hypothetical protein
MIEYRMLWVVHSAKAKIKTTHEANLLVDDHHLFMMGPEKGLIRVPMDLDIR